MTGVALKYTIEDHQALAMLDKVADFDARRMFQEIGEHLVSTTVKRFTDGTDPEGRPWPPSQRVLEHPGDKTLIDFGHLRQSITYRAFHDQVEVGTNLTYGAIHQFGGEAGRNLSVKLPPRPFLGLTGDDRAEIDEIVTKHLRRAMR